MALGMGPNPHPGAFYRIHEPLKISQQGRPFDDEAGRIEVLQATPYKFNRLQFLPIFYTCLK